MISIVILTHNESINIADCLASVAWSDDVLVIDSGSSDTTCETAQKLGARVMHRKFDNFASQRNFATEQGQLRHVWVLHLDADERVTEQLKNEMLAIACLDNAQPGYRVPSRLMLMDQWLKHSGMYPRYQVRFGKTDQLRFHMVGHGQRELLESAQVGTLTGDLIHYNFSKGISEWLTKHARYARDEAANMLVPSGQHIDWSALLQPRDPIARRRQLKLLGQAIPMKPAARFVYVYFAKLGFLDGRAGFRYALLMATYQWAIDLNVIELRQKNRSSTT